MVPDLNVKIELQPCEHSRHTLIPTAVAVLPVVGDYTIIYLWPRHLSTVVIIQSGHRVTTSVVADGNRFQLSKH